MTKPREVELWPCDYSAALLVTVERHCRLLLQGWRDQRSERSGLRDFMCCDSVQSDSDFPWETIRVRSPGCCIAATVILQSRLTWAESATERTH